MWSTKGRQGTWPQALRAFFLPILAIMAVRWAGLEPFVIPSGSMIPNLLVHDHVFVKKYSLGLRWPFTSKWLVKWREPERGEIMVFRYPPDPEVFYVKRLIGKPGDVVRVQDGRVTVNGETWKLTNRGTDDEDFNLYTEAIPGHAHTVRFHDDEPRQESQEWTVPEHQYFMMGDNRDQSADSRTWGFVPEENLLGPAWLIWMSCDEMLSSARFLCDPATLRWDRLFRNVSLPETEN